ncbi:IS3 family transposase [Rhodanobacter sp. BL-MT-08]
MKWVRYTAEQRQWAIEQMGPPTNRRIRALALASGITEVTLRTWRNAALIEGSLVRKDSGQSERWSGPEKFRIVVESAPMNEAELSEYCRRIGLLPEQIRQWRVACEQANAPMTTAQGVVKPDSGMARERIRQLERELRRKDAALAETAALLVLRKKPRGDLGQGRGRMTSPSDRREALALLDDAVAAGARLAPACAMLALSIRTVQRWRQKPEDARPQAHRPAPAHQLSDEERRHLLAAANEPAHAQMTPHQIVPKLADEGIFLASESTFYRVLKAASQTAHRGRSKAPQRRAPTTHRATGPNQVWCWDITWMPSTVKGRYFYWYMVKDIHSRLLVANEVHEAESSDHASDLIRKACLRERIVGRPLVLHSDNGSAMKGAVMLATLHELGVASSFSRPRVSNDNAYAEALFRTAKYCPLWPERPFDTIDEARVWVNRFVAWYNHEHRHSALNYVTPSQRHCGHAERLLAARAELYAKARQRHPARWARHTRDWTLANEVYLNPERTELKHAA